jgi:hypothetical protein
MPAGSVHIPWYATVFRGDQLAEALKEIAPVALRYGAREYAIFRSRDDRYKFNHTVFFVTKEEWERYWLGPEFVEWRSVYTSWYQVPVLYVWNDIVAAGRSEVAEPAERIV